MTGDKIHLLCIRVPEPDKPELVLTLRSHKRTFVVPLTKDQVKLMASQLMEVLIKWPDQLVP